MLHGLTILIIYLMLVVSLRAVAYQLHIGKRRKSTSWLTRLDEGLCRSRINEGSNFLKSFSVIFVKWIDRAYANLFGTDVVVPNVLPVKSVNALVFGLPPLFLVESVSYIQYLGLRFPRNYSRHYHSGLHLLVTKTQGTYNLVDFRNTFPI